MSRLSGSVCLALIILTSGLGFSHPGGIDAECGHQSRKPREYHYHPKREAASPVVFWQAEQSSRISTAIREQRLNDYFRQANEKVGAFDCNQVIHKRDVSESIRKEVRNRDGNRCVICSSTQQLELDHRRALLNGGDNSAANLATLCEDCHTAKTRMDNSLRRKREKICRH